MSVLVQPLFDGPIDVIGDVHGEAGALDQLLERLGYGAQGRHRAGRRLVFVGDLVDRGEDSPSVVERVAELSELGRAQVVLGNHELNLLVGERKEGNGWWFPDDHDRANGRFEASRGASSSQRGAFEAWMRTLPLALERSDLRVVHACWDAESVARLRGRDTEVAALHSEFSSAIDTEHAATGLLARRQAELDEWGPRLEDRSAQPPFLVGMAETDVSRQSGHPVKALTSGLEVPAAAPFYASGKWRMSERIAWWQQYMDDAAVIIGHYWRWPGRIDNETARTRGPDLFPSANPQDWLGPKRNVMCADWCAGLRWHERRRGVECFVGRLGAVRWPEGEVVWV